jgi:hypothetical protein
LTEWFGSPSIANKPSGVLPIQLCRKELKRRSILKKIMAFALLVVGTAGIISAAPRAVPEIDAGSAASASALIGSALLMLRRRKAR